MACFISRSNFASGLDSSHLSAVHEIMSMSPKDEGSYTCQAVNAAGITEERVQIRLEEDNGIGGPEPCRGDAPCEDDDRHPGNSGEVRFSKIFFYPLVLFFRKIIFFNAANVVGRFFTGKRFLRIRKKLSNK